MTTPDLAAIVRMKDFNDCPFCGADDSEDNAVQEAGVFLRWVKSAIGGRAFRIECRCGASGPVEADPEIAKVKWNKRTPEKTDV
jgi:hypothetical protein